MTRRAVIVILALSLGPRVSTPAERPAETIVPFDAGAVVRQVHFAFRRHGDRFIGGHSTYGVEVAAGQVSIRPVKAGPDRPAAGDPRVLRTPRIADPRLVVATSMITRGARAFPLDVQASVDRQGELIRRGPAVQEHLANREDGVELSWRFETRPQGSGEMVVRVAVTGMAHRLESARGHHFQDPASRLGVRFGHATWIGADGRRTAIPLRWSGSEIVIAVPARVVDDSAYPAVLDPILAPEFDLTTPVIGPAADHQWSPSVAHDPASGRYLVVWHDYRPMSPQAFATRVSPAGEVLDPLGLLVSATHDGAASTPSVVFDGTSFLVVFSAAANIWGRRIAPDGTFVDPEPFAISNHPANQRDPFASSNGTVTLVVWEDFRNSGSGPDIYAARVAGATVLDGAGTGLPIASSFGYEQLPRAAWGNGQWFVVWTQGQSNETRVVYGARVSGATGAVLPPGRLTLSAGSGNRHHPWPASNGEDFFVVWQDERSGLSSADIYGARVLSSTGAVLDPTGIPVCLDTRYQARPAVAFASGASHYQVVWEDSRRDGLYGNRVHAATASLLDGPEGISIAGSGALTNSVSAPRVFATGDHYYVAWEAFGAHRDIHGSRLTAATVLLDAPGVNLARSANGQTEAAVAADADNYLVVWVDDQGGTTAIYAARVDGATGESLDPAGVLLSEGGYDESYPAVAFNGTDYLVVWTDYRQPYGIYGTRVTPSGEVRDPGGLAIYTEPGWALAGFRFSAVASNGSEWLVVADHYGPTVFGVGATRVGPSGAVLGDPVIPLSASGADARVAFGGGHYLVVWCDRRAVRDGELYGARLDASAVVQEPGGIPIATGPGWMDFQYDVAYAPPNFVVAYSKGFSLFRARVASASGSVLDTAPLAIGGGGPAIAPYGDGTLVVYNAGKATRVSGAGVDLDPVDWDVVADAGAPWLSIATRPGSPADSLVAYSRYDPTPGITSERVRARGLSTPDLLFADGFESSDLSAWSSAGTDDGDLAVGVGAAMAATTAGLGAVVDDTTGLFVTDETPDNEERYRARFYFDPNGFDPGEAQAHRRTRIFVAFEEGPTRRLVAVVLRRLDGAYAVMGRARLDDGSHADTGFVPISDGPHVVELHWRRATSSDVADGSFELWVDGVPAGSLSGLDNHLSAVDFVRMGALSVKAGASGTLLFDEMESRRWSYIGP